MPAIDQYASLLKAAGSPTRLQILALLAERGRTARELTALTGVSYGMVTKHLRTLRENSLIETDDASVNRLRPQAADRIRRAVPEIFPAPPPLPDDV